MSLSSSGPRLKGRWAVDVSLVLGIPIATNLAVATGIGRATAIALQLVAAVIAVVFARVRGYTIIELGVATASVRSGLRLGGLMSGLIAVTVAGIALVPVARPFFEDDRFVDDRAVDVLVEAIVRIPLATALTEELLFRSVLLAVLRARLPLDQAIAWTSAGFAVWHLATASAGLVGILITLLATGVAGVGFAWLRIASGSIVAPWMAHTTLNSTTYLAGALLAGAL